MKWYNHYDLLDLDVGVGSLLEESLAVVGVHVLPLLLLGHVTLHPVQILEMETFNIIADLPPRLTFSIEEAHSWT